MQDIDKKLNELKRKHFNSSFDLNDPTFADNKF
jgi:hypothetical protein